MKAGLTKAGYVLGYVGILTSGAALGLATVMAAMYSLL